MDDVTLTPTTAKVLRYFLKDPGEPRYGLELVRETGVQSGSLYPILARLVRAGWLSAAMETLDLAAAGRPARRYYLLTAEGCPAARLGLAALSEQFRPPAYVIGVLRPEAGRA